MKKLTTLVMALLLSFGATCFANENHEPLIRVLIAKDINAALLEAKGPYAVLREGSKEILSSGSLGKRFVVQPIDCGLRWGEEYPDDYQIQVIPRQLPGAPETTMYVDGIQYRGSMTIYYNKAGGICIVNEVPLEDFLKSTLASEFATSLSPEAMASYAIAARTNAYAQIAQAKSAKRVWDISGPLSKYYGLGVTKQKNGVDEAVDKTKYIVLTKGNAPVLNVALSKEEAESKSASGLDAKKILTNICPGSNLSVTVPTDAEVIR